METGLFPFFLAYVPVLFFFGLSIKGLKIGHQNSAGRKYYKDALSCIVLHNFLCLLVWPLVFTWMKGNSGIRKSTPYLISYLIMTAITFWWRMSAVQWYEEKCREENFGELPKDA